MSSFRDPLPHRGNSFRSSKFVVCLFASSVALTALGDLFDAHGNRLTSLQITQDEATGQPDYAQLAVYDRSTAHPGRAVWTCFDQQPTPHLNALVFDTRSAEAPNQIRTAAVRVRVDEYPARRFEAVLVYSRPGRESLPPSTGTGEITPDRGFLDELTGGQALVLQIGALRALSLDLAASNQDVVKFTQACDRMYATLMRSSRRWASAGLEFLDPVTDRGQIGLNLYHETSHDGGHQPDFFLHCSNNENAHGVNLGVNLPRVLHNAVASLPAAPTLQIRVEAAPARQFVLTNDRGQRWTTFHLAAAGRPPIQLLDEFGRAHTMTAQLPDLPAYRFDLAAARPAINAFAAKCAAMIQQPSIEAT